MLSFRQRLMLALIPFRMRARTKLISLCKRYADWTDWVMEQALIKLEVDKYDDVLYKFHLGESIDLDNGWTLRYDEESGYTIITPNDDTQENN